MKKNVIRNIFLLLVIPAIICIVIAVVNTKKDNYDSTLDLDSSNTITDTTSVEPTYEANFGEEIVNTIKKHDTTIIFSVIGGILLFAAFYVYVKKGTTDKEEKEVKKKEVKKKDTK